MGAEIPGTGLAALEEEVRRQLTRTGGEPANWVPPTAGTDHDVVIVGAGQSGLAIAFALRRAGIPRIALVDAAPAGRTGTWTTKARMKTLRTVKTLAGPELGVPGLAFQSWYEARHGAQAYEAIGMIALADWADYIDWYARMTQARVEHETRLLATEPSSRVPGALDLTLATPQGTRQLTTRKLVLATGGAGGGAAAIPPAVADALPTALHAHTDDDIDFARLRGRVVGVVGAAASAFDAAGVALEAGAAAVHLFSRGADLTRTISTRNTAYAGVPPNFFHLSDEERWRLGEGIFGRALATPTATVRRATRFDNFHLHLGTPVRSLAHVDGRIAFGLPGGERLMLDFLVLGTGYRMDLSLRPELSALAPHALAWKDRIARAGTDPRGGYPYLGSGFELLEKTPGRMPGLANVHLFSYGAIASFGRHVGDIASLSVSVPRLVSAISRDLFLADHAQHVDRMLGPLAQELSEDDYRHAVHPRGVIRATPSPGG